MFILQLNFNGLLDGRFMLLKATVMLMFELILQIGNLSAEAKIELFTHSSFFGCQG